MGRRTKRRRRRRCRWNRAVGRFVLDGSTLLRDVERNGATRTRLCGVIVTCDEKGRAIKQIIMSAARALPRGMPRASSARDRWTAHCTRGRRVASATMHVMGCGAWALARRHTEETRLRTEETATATGKRRTRSECDSARRNQRQARAPHPRSHAHSVRVRRGRGGLPVSSRVHVTELSRVQLK